MFVTRKKYSVPGWPETRWMNFLCLWRSVLWSRLPVTLIRVLWNPQLVTCSTDPCFMRKRLAIQSPAFFNIIFIVVVVHQYTCSSKLGMFFPCLLYQCSQSRLLYSLKENVLLCPLEVIKLLSFSDSRSFQVERLWWWLFFLFFSVCSVFYKVVWYPIPTEGEAQINFSWQEGDFHIKRWAAVLFLKVDFKSEQILICVWLKHYLTPMRYSKTDS